MTSRDAFIARVRSAVARGRRPTAPDADPGLLVPDLPPADLVELFTERVRAVDGEVARVDGLDEAVDAIVTRLRRSGTTDLLLWDADHLPLGGLPRALVERGYRPVGADVVGDRARIDPIQVGVTGADAAFAESGSIVVTSGPRRARVASLTVEDHVVLLPESRIHRSLAHWMAAVEDTLTSAPPANLVIVTGPSRTGDIEQTLTLGVHGPRSLLVLLLPG